MSTTESLATAVTEDVPADIAVETAAAPSSRAPKRTKATKIKEPITGRLFKWLTLLLVALVMLAFIFVRRQDAIDADEGRLDS